VGFVFFVKNAKARSGGKASIQTHERARAQKLGEILSEVASFPITFLRFHLIFF
jgi:hypothetical protein